MPSRRAFVTSSFISTVAFISGCVGGSDDEDSEDLMSDDDVEDVLNQYELEADSHSAALEALREGFVNYSHLQYNRAATSFETAQEILEEVEFQSLTSDIMGERAASLEVESAVEARRDAEIVAGDCQTACRSLSMDPNQPEHHETVENALRRFDRNDFDIPPRNDVERAFDS